MTTLIDAVQKQDPGSALVELFELELPAGTLYFTAAVEANLTTVQFREKLPTDGTYAPRTYTAIPIELKGIERKTDGAAARPTLTVANVLSTFRDAIGTLTNKDLIGKRLVRRTTLQRYLVNEADDSTTAPPIEFPTEKFIIDRIASENKVAITFELASAADLEGVMLPNRIVVGKYCSWEYQGASNRRGGCIWAPDSKPAGTTNKAYFNLDDEPIVSGDVTTMGTVYSSSTAYGEDDVVRHGGHTWRSNSTSHIGNTPAFGSLFWTRVWSYTVYSASATYGYSATSPVYVEYPPSPGASTIWKTTRPITVAGKTPAIGSQYWTRGDLCGKILSSCKCRFQYKQGTNMPSVHKNTEKILPFGGFPGSEKYR